jgi:hypothetical protein
VEICRASFRNWDRRTSRLSRIFRSTILGMDGDRSSPATRRFEVALQTRQLEIGLFWQRSLFFWGFISVAFVALVGLKEEHPRLSLLVSGFGLVCSASWSLVNRGSKYWQEQWESKIEHEEVAPVGPLSLFKKREPEQSRKGWWLRGRRYSVSKITIAVSDYICGVWVGVLAWRSWICLKEEFVFLRVFQCARCKHILVVALCVLPVVYSVLLLVCGRSTPSGIFKH